MFKFFNKNRVFWLWLGILFLAFVLGYGATWGWFHFMVEQALAPVGSAPALAP